MAQVVVLGPNGARTTANNVARPTDPIGPDGKPESELSRLLRGVIPGREGYKGGQQLGIVTEDYEGVSQSRSAISSLVLNLALGGSISSSSPASLTLNSVGWNPGESPS